MADLGDVRVTILLVSKDGNSSGRRSIIAVKAKAGMSLARGAGTILSAAQS